ncbi:MAG: 2-oxo acid dehydrogenase subunit E2 [Oscillospiraceae bacterium]|nr:2-oxo acid dehydrogenase subunit E2 [Oscillospiraceae bacterium]
MAKTKWGDRKDGIWLKDIPALNRIMPSLLPNRADNEAYINIDIDLRPLNAYLEKLNEGRTADKYTFFHLVSAAIAKAFILRPKMNRFIVGSKMYQRRDVTVGFAVKKQFNDHAEEGLAFFTFDPKETLESYHQKIMAQIHLTKSDVAKDTSTGAMDIICKLPQWMITGIVKLVLWLDKYGWAPESLVGSDPNHAAIFLSNLGSIGLPGGYHHLVNWGTNSCFVVVGKKYWKQEIDTNGNAEALEVLPLGITLDERIADGYYYSGTVALVKELLAHPELLELPADTPVEYAIQR